MTKARELLNELDDSDNLLEKSLSRTLAHMKNHDTGTITAYRSAMDCGNGEPYSKSDNQKRNKSLLAKLQAMRYGVTSVKGSYIENYGSANAKEVGEHVFFVVDLENKGNLEKDLRKLGEEFEQDSILFIEKGGDNSVLIGTNKCPNGYPGYGKKVSFKERQIASTGEFMTKVRNRPFIFREALREHVLPQGHHARWACSVIAKKSWKELDE